MRSCSEVDKAVAVSAMCVMAGASIEVVGMRGSMFVRIYADGKGRDQYSTTLESDVSEEERRCVPSGWYP